jgi:hypothetical protein
MENDNITAVLQINPKMLESPSLVSSFSPLEPRVQYLMGGLAFRIHDVARGLEHFMVRTYMVILQTYESSQTRARVVFFFNETRSLEDTRELRDTSCYVSISVLNK